MTVTPTYPSGTEEYVKAVVRADVTLTDSMTVELSLSTGNGTTGYTHDWLTGAWEGDEGTTRTARTALPVLFDATYPGPTYALFVRLTDNPEVPIMSAGVVRVQK